MKKEQLNEAFRLGQEAFKRGMKCVPAWDGALMNMLKGREINKTPEGEADTTELLDQWSKGWHDMNLKLGRDKMEVDYFHAITHVKLETMVVDLEGTAEYYDEIKKLVAGKWGISPDAVYFITGKALVA